jgi:hypothetical protein
MNTTQFSTTWTRHTHSHSHQQLSSPLLTLLRQKSQFLHQLRNLLLPLLPKLLPLLLNPRHPQAQLNSLLPNRLLRNLPSPPHRPRRHPSRLRPSNHLLPRLPSLARPLQSLVLLLLLPRLPLRALTPPRKFSRSPFQVQAADRQIRRTCKLCRTSFLRCDCRIIHLGGSILY